jgi:uncharacterized protein YdbL (DUF1318 family)
MNLQLFAPERAAASIALPTSKSITNRAMLEARDKATDADHLLIAESNANRLKRLSDVAKSNGISLESVQRRHAAKWREKVPAGSGIWYQDDAGAWLQK